MSDWKQTLSAILSLFAFLTLQFSLSLSFLLHLHAAHEASLHTQDNTPRVFHSSPFTTVGQAMNEGHDMVLCLSEPPPQWSDGQNLNNTSLFSELPKQHSCYLFCHLCLLLIILYRAEVEHIFTTYVTRSNSNMCVFMNSNYVTFRGSFHCGITYCNISTEQHPGCDRNNRLIIFLPVLLDSILHSWYFQHSGLNFLSGSIKASALVFPSQTCSGWQLQLESISGWRWLQSVFVWWIVSLAGNLSTSVTQTYTWHSVVLKSSAKFSP